MESDSSKARCSSRPVKSTTFADHPFERHFKGALEEVVGRLNWLAEKDPERFTWESMENMHRKGKCRRFKEGSATDHKGVPYGKSALEKTRRALVKGGIVKRESKFRGGAWRRGFIVARHEDVCRIQNGQCVLIRPVTVEWHSPSRRTQAADTAADTVAATVPATDERPKDTVRATVAATDYSPYVVKPTTSSEGGYESDGEASLSQSCQSFESSESGESCQSFEPVKVCAPVPEEERQGGCDERQSNALAPSQKPKADIRLTKHDKTAVGKADYADLPAIGYVFGHLAEESAAAQHDDPGLIIPELSDGRFDLRYAQGYEQLDMLARCCRVSIESLAAEPYCGLATNARIMGNVMERFKTHGMEVPPGWLPVMKSLRKDPGARPQCEQVRERLNAWNDSHVEAPEPAEPQVRHTGSHADQTPATRNDTPSSGSGVRLASAQGVLIEFQKAVFPISKNAPVAFNAQQGANVINAIETHGMAAVVAAFEEFYVTLDDYSLKWADKNFSERVDQLALSAKLRKEEQERGRILFEKTEKEFLASAPPPVEEIVCNWFDEEGA